MFQPEPPELFGVALREFIVQNDLLPVRIRNVVTFFVAQYFVKLKSLHNRKLFVLV